MKKQVITLVGALALLSGCAHMNCHHRCYAKNCNNKADFVLESTAFFAFDSSKLNTKDTSSLDKVVQHLKEHPNEKVVLNGYTDSTGAADYNVGLSKRRANAVAQYLKNNGVAADRITTKGYGATDFVGCNKTEAGRAKNRRTEVIFVK